MGVMITMTPVLMQCQSGTKHDPCEVIDNEWIADIDQHRSSDQELCSYCLRPGVPVRPAIYPLDWMRLDYKLNEQGVT